MKGETILQLRAVAKKLGEARKLIDEINEDNLDDETTYSISRAKTAYLRLRMFE